MKEESKECCKADTCSMKSDSTKHSCAAMMHGSEKNKMGCCKGMKKKSCGESTMGKKSEHHSGKAKVLKTPKSPEPKKTDK